MDEASIIWCGPDKPPGNYRDTGLIHLNSHPQNSNINLKIENITRLLARDLPSLLLDLLEIAAFVYGADQIIGRGGVTLPGDGQSWRRYFRFHIAVRNPDIWNNNEIKEALIDVLSFLSDENFEFEFRPLKTEIPLETYFDFKEDLPWFKSDHVMLFSGGLDSLAGLCESYNSGEGKILLVSHRPAPQTSKLQKDLLADFNRITGNRDRLLHAPIWVNKSSQLTRETTQRTRSFLYMALASSLAMLHNLRSIHFYENGITSSNLPIAENVIGARASRTTHPKVLKGFGKLLSLIFNQEFRVLNPFFWKTKADIVEVIRDYGFSDLIRYASSCSHVRTSTIINTHCGVCFQCIGRRMATLYHGLQTVDPVDIYRIRLPLDEIRKPDERGMVELVIKAGREFAQIDPIAFFGKYGEASRIVSSLDLPTSEAGERLYQLHKRYGEQICAVLANFIKSNSELIAKGMVPQDSLLSMIAGQESRAEVTKDVIHHFPTPDGITWDKIIVELISEESVRIRAGTVIRTYTAFDMGFRDLRKADRPNKLWNILKLLAEGNGILKWEEMGNEGINYKDINRLRTLFRTFFGLNGLPISKYSRRDGYSLCFRIIDCRFGKNPS